MERWLSKPRVMLALGAVMLAATLNRRDPLIYGLFLFLLSLGALGWALPWASLRRLALSANGQVQLMEGDASSISLRLEQEGWWPVFMVEVHARWEWAGRQIEMRHVVPVLRRGKAQHLGRHVRFDCRGHYRLREIRLVCSFPLGLIEAQVVHGGFDVACLVLPKRSSYALPRDLPISADDRGMQVTRRFGHSSEMETLRDYLPGDRLRHIHWRASARSGHLIVQQHLQSGSPRLRVVVQIPDRSEVGQPQTPAEQAIRTAADLCRQALAEGMRVRAYLSAIDSVGGIDDIERALACAAPGTLQLAPTLARAAAELCHGDILAVVVPITLSAPTLLAALMPVQSARVLVCVAGHQARIANHAGNDLPLLARLDAAGIPWWMHKP